VPKLFVTAAELKGHACPMGSKNLRYADLSIPGCIYNNVRLIHIVENKLNGESPCGKGVKKYLNKLLTCSGVFSVHAGV
jgi:hypothetical protein